MNLCPDYSVHLIVIATTYHAASPQDECFATMDRNFTLRYIGRVPFDQNFRFDFPKFSYVEWNGIFHFAGPISFHSRLRTFALIVSAHPYSARKSTCHAMPRHTSSARAKY